MRTVDWTYVHFASALPVMKDLNLTHKETIVLAAECWAPSWSNKHIAHSDKQAAVGIINKGSTCVISIMPYLSSLFWLSVI